MLSTGYANVASRELNLIVAMVSSIILFTITSFYGKSVNYRQRHQMILTYSRVKLNRLRIHQQSATLTSLLGKTSWRWWRMLLMGHWNGQPTNNFNWCSAKMFIIILLNCIVYFYNIYNIILRKLMYECILLISWFKHGIIICSIASAHDQLFESLKLVGTKLTIIIYIPFT
jgi:hypothetical protein